MTTRFHECLNIVIGNEGGLSNHKDDRGGKTNYGVTTKTYHAYLKSLGLPLRDVADIHPSEVEAIYLQYWKDARCGYLGENLDLAHFDFAINAGARRANKTLQRVLGVDEDGVIGRQTLQALHEEVVAAGNDEVTMMYMDERRAFYRRIVEMDETQKVFIKGWLARCDHLEDLMNLPVSGSTDIGGVA